MTDRLPLDSDARGGVFYEINIPLLKSTIWLTVVLSLAFVVFLLTGPPYYRWRAIFPFCLAIIALGARLSLRYDGGIPAVRLFAFGAWLLATAAGFTVDGVRTPILLIYPTILIYAGWVLGLRYGVGLYIATSAAIVAMALGERAGFIGQLNRVPAAIIAGVHLFVLSVSVMLTWFLARIFQQREAEKLRLAGEVQSNLRAAEKSASELRMLAEHIPALVFEIDRTGRIVFANQRFGAFFGVAAGQLGESSIAEVIGLDLINTLPQMRDAAQERHVEFNLRRQSAQGVWHSFDATLVPRQAADSKAIAGWYGLMHDVTRREDAAVELLERATRDGLTDAWNRRKFEEVIAAEMQRTARYGPPISMLLLDIDHFKAINDTHGHVAGDRVLRGIADRVRESMRGSDSLTRWGGEEFIVLAPGTSLPDAHVLAQRICEHVAQQGFAEVGRVTISIGVAEHLPSETFENWLNRVDQAMYESKQLGRNQVRSNTAGVSDRSALEGEEDRFVKLVWKSTFVSGNELIDEQHAHLFRISNDLLDAVLSRKPPYEISAAIARLLDSIARHFEDEETILRELGFAKLTEHIEAHARLIAKGHDLAQAFRAGELSIGPLLQYLTYDLVAMHILCADREYFDLTLLNLPSRA